MTAPRATMRLQLHKGFTFDDAARIAPYMARLGISHLYCSPILTARAGSMHGYDVVDPTRVNPELGGEEGFRRVVGAMRAEGLGIVVDIVPNHMAVGNENPWWREVLRGGPHSRYGHFFDIDWRPDDPLLHEKVLVPVLGRQYGEALAAGEIALVRDDGGFSAKYFDKLFPVRTEDAAEIERQGLDAFDLSSESGRQNLHRLLERQHYRLSFWRTAPDEINYRRFFDINDLAGIRAEDADVFEATHATIFRLYAEGLIDGLRIDHVDGLSDPRSYCRRLRARLRELDRQRPSDVPPGPAWIVVEKILGEGEELPTDWQVDGTSGYDFMDLVSAVQHDPSAADSLGELWSSLSGRPADFSPEEEKARREILDRSFTAQLESTVGALHVLARRDLKTRDLSRAALRRALVALLAHFPVYRSYATGEVRPPGDESAFARALAGAEGNPGLARVEVLRQLVDWLRTPDDHERRIAATRFQQLSAPVAAKAVEDTAFYRYGRLISRNDVGFAARRLGIPLAEFHAGNSVRARDFPSAMLATATHDHKRGEDVRARLAVISEIPEVWGQTLRAWMEWNARFRRLAGKAPAPGPGDEIILYQTLVGTYPLDGDLQDPAQRSAYMERIAAWQSKALHEAKLETSWTRPNEEYESASRGFLEAVLQDDTFLCELRDFVDRISAAGALNGLAQAAMKLTVPGVPDLYQGTEFWDQSLVDPDNRRPVDFPAREQALAKNQSPPALLGSWRNGHVKQAMIHRLLELRREAPELFAKGSYVPLQATGRAAEHVISFARRQGDRAALIAVPRWPHKLVAGTDPRIAPETLAGTKIAPPAWLVGRRMRHALTGADTQLGDSLDVQDLLERFPIAVLCG